MRAVWEPRPRVDVWWSAWLYRGEGDTTLCALQAKCPAGMHLSTLRSHIKAMGGDLDIVARFPDGSVKITNFADLGKAAAFRCWSGDGTASPPPHPAHLVARLPKLGF